MVRPLLALLLLLAPAPEFAQTAKPRTARKTAPKPAPATRWPIESLAIEGNQNYAREPILAVTGLKVGQLAGKSDFEAARDRILATGLFASVGYRFVPSKDSSGYAASFQVVEVTPVYPVVFEGLPANAADLHSLLKSKDPLYAGKLPGTAELLARYSAWIEEFLSAKNQNQKVVGKLGPTGADQFGVLFRSAKALPAVAQVKFTGNQALSTQLLQSKIAEAAIGFPYTEDTFRALLDNSVRRRYDALGRVAVSFPKITAEKAQDVDGVVVDVTVAEGPEFKLGEVQFAGKYAAKSAQMQKVAKFKIGETANFDEISSGIVRIQKSLERQGYIRVTTGVDRAVHEKTKTVDITIHIEEGPLFTMGKLTVEGLDLNGEAGIRKLWATKEGQPFDAEYPDYFMNRVREDGLFDNLHNNKASTKVDEQNHTVDVTLRFH